MKRRNYFILVLLLLLSNVCISQNKTVTVSEQKNINLFNDFINYVISAVHKKEDIADTAHLRYIVLNYVFTNTQFDSSDKTTINNNELSEDRFKSLKKELNIFYTFLQQYEKDHLATNLTLMPIRLSHDTFIYGRLTSFQKENTFILYDKRFPGKAISYVLFIPAVKNIIGNGRIWSWTLLFKFGKYMFKSLTGEEGYEYIFSPEEFKK